MTLLPLAALAAALVLLPLAGGEYAAYQLGLFLIYAMVTQGIALTWGRAGFLPLGQAVFFGLGAYLAGFALKSSPLLGGALSADAAAAWAPSTAAPAWQVVTLVASLAGAVLLPALLAWVVGRLVFARRHESGPFFSLITLALAMLGFQLANQWSGVTGGFNGLGGIPELPGLDRYGNLYWLIAAFSLAVTAAFAWLNTTPLGTLWTAVSQNEDRLQFFGFATDRLKALAFAISAAAAGLAGALYALHQGLVTPQATGFLLSAEFVIWAAVGGRKSPYGALIGAVGIGLLSSELRDRVGWWEAAVAVVFIAVVLRFPGGIAGALATAFARPAGGATGANVAAAVSASAGPAGAGRLAAPPIAAATRVPAALRFDDVRVRIGGVDILDGLSVAVGPGGLHCLIGPNGAGKTSSFNALTGRLPITGGRILLDGRVVTGWRADRIARAGVGRKFQIPSVFSDLSVADNLRIAVWANRATGFALLKSATRDWSTPLSEGLTGRLDLTGDPATTRAGALSQGQRQMLELTMTLIAEPRLLLLDEPCAGLSAAETARQIGIIRDGAAALGATALIIEHDMAAVEALADEVHVLHQGRLLASGSLARIQGDAAVRSVYAGGRK